MFTTVVIGCGDRAATYCEAAVHLLGEMKVAAAMTWISFAGSTIPRPRRL